MEDQYNPTFLVSSCPANSVPYVPLLASHLNTAGCIIKTTYTRYRLEELTNF